MRFTGTLQFFLLFLFLWHGSLPFRAHNSKVVFFMDNFILNFKILYFSGFELFLTDFFIKYRVNMQVHARQFSLI